MENNLKMVKQEQQQQKRKNMYLPIPPLPLHLHNVYLIIDFVTCTNEVTTKQIYFNLLRVSIYIYMYMV